MATAQTEIDSADETMTDAQKLQVTVKALQEIVLPLSELKAIPLDPKSHAVTQIESLVCNRFFYVRLAMKALAEIGQPVTF